MLTYSYLQVWLSSAPPSSYISHSLQLCSFLLLLSAFPSVDSCGRDHTSWGCCTILSDRVTYISQHTVYFCSIIIHPAGRQQSGGKQGRAGPSARKALPPFPCWLRHLRRLRRLLLASSAEGSLLSPLPGSQNRSEPQLTGLGTRAAGRGVLSTTQPHELQMSPAAMHTCQVWEGNPFFPWTFKRTLCCNSENIKIYQKYSIAHTCG